MPMKISGNEKSATIRVRSRSSLMKSRCASVRTPESSLIVVDVVVSFGLRRHDLEIRVLKSGGMRAHHRERRVDRLQHRVYAAACERDLERTVSMDRKLQPRELLAQTAAIVGVDQHVFLHEVLLDGERGSIRDDLSLIDDAEVVGLLGL